MGKRTECERRYERGHTGREVEIGGRRRRGMTDSRVVPSPRDDLDLELSTSGKVYPLCAGTGLHGVPCRGSRSD